MYSASDTLMATDGDIAAGIKRTGPRMMSPWLITSSARTGQNSRRSGGVSCGRFGQPSERTRLMSWLTVSVDYICTRYVKIGYSRSLSTADIE